MDQKQKLVTEILAIDTYLKIRVYISTTLQTPTLLFLKDLRDKILLPCFWFLETHRPKKQVTLNGCKIQSDISAAEDWLFFEKPSLIIPVFLIYLL